MPYKLYLYAAAALMAAMWAYWLHGKIDQGGFDRAVGIYAIAALKATDAARSTEQAWQLKSQGAQNESRQRQAILNDYAIGLRSERDGLRIDLAARSNPLPGDTTSPGDNYAAALGVVLDQCAAEYTELALKTDGHSSDTLMLIDAWP